ncbi:MAG: ATP-dependent RecD-like DNA helicase [Clostridiales bacterium]|nr:ATP-dependent RecD-like DNA helicase [Clostridiales bacterium]
MEKIITTIENIVYRNEDNGYIVFDFEYDNELETATGQLPHLSEGERIEMQGMWNTHSSYGKQFNVKSVKKLPLDSKVGLIRYLASGIIKGIGPATAKRIVDKFGMDAMDVIRYAPGNLTQVEGIGTSKALLIAQNMTEQVEMQEKMSFLLKFNISVNLAHKIIKKYKNNTKNTIENNPYLLASDIEGVGFLTADKIAKQVGITHNSQERTRAGALHILNEAAMQDGHCCLPLDLFYERSVALLDESQDLIIETATKMTMLRDIVIEKIDNVRYVFLPSYYKAEKEIAKRLSDILKADRVFDDYDIDSAVIRAADFSGITLSHEQKLAVSQALMQGAMVITGGPGTGKTTTINCLIRAFEHAGIKVELAAPTGRAAKRMSEATGHDARTIHRLLEYGYNGDSDILLFGRNEENPLKCGVVIIDEMSMVDIFLMQHLLRAITGKTRIIMVGDADQLPSVGPGNVLYDIIHSRTIETARLEVIFRQAQQSQIVMNAHRINKGKFPILDDNKSDFFFISKTNSEEAIETIIQMAGTRIPKYLKCSLHNIQILAPTKKRDLGVHNLNNRLQEQFNPPDIDKNEYNLNGIIFRVGDKVMQIKNNYTMEWRKSSYKSADQAGEGVFNGDIGFITDINNDGSLMTVKFDDGKICEYTKEKYNELMLAYAVTIHKAQGCEFDVVIIPLLSVPPVFMSRNILYTAVTRAKKMVLIVGDKKVVNRMAQSMSAIKRYTGLQNELEKSR